MSTTEEQIEAVREGVAPPLPDPPHSVSLLDYLQALIIPLNEIKEWIEQHRQLIDRAPKKPTIGAFHRSVDFDTLTHAEVVEVIRLFGGKWSKTVNSDNQHVDYEAEIDGQTVRCWQGEPPPSCQIVEVEVEMPAVPAHRQTVRKLVCLKEDVEP